MGYTFTRTEHNTSSAEEYETRTMMYLMNMNRLENNLDIFLIDAFNDVSGVCSQKKWQYIVDAQSKGYTSFPPTTIGKSLITLFLNHYSIFDFTKYILLCKKIDPKYLSNISGHEIPCYQLFDFNDSTYKRVIKALEKEFDRIQGTGAFKCLPVESLQDFYNRTYIVVDTTDKGDYIKNAIPLNKLSEMDSVKLSKIFDEITDKRVSLKKINIENKTIHHISECMQYKKYINRKTIESLIVSRVVGYDVFKPDMSIPRHFLRYINGLDNEEIKENMILVNSEVSRTFFDINNSDIFFKYIDAILEVVTNTQNVEDIYNILVTNGVHIPVTLSEISSKYLISMIVGGFYDN